jgi:hypothetical protein
MGEALRNSRARLNTSSEVSRTYACELPLDRDALSLTDWAEAVMLVEQLQEFSESDLRGRLVEQASEEDDEEPRGRQYVEDVLREVSRRARHAPDAYPFRRGAVGIELSNPRLLTVYTFLLWLSLPNTPFRRKIYTNAVTPLFDHVGEAALATLLGPGARVVRFGWPVSGGRPTGPRGALRWLATQMNVHHDDDAPVSQALKDAGVDVVLWRPFEDRRAGFPILLAQCTVGQAEWKRKGCDIRRPLWRRYLGLGWDPPTTLVLPFCVEDPDRFQSWNLVSHDVSFIIDRLRLLELLASVERTDIPEVARIEQWTAERRDDLILA